ncbi:MAG: hypothetical protein IKB64_05720 [Paludibacteraceae bacterium]|nr:hypothetical protein [Paludibacteraceae bacterium]
MGYRSQVAFKTTSEGFAIIQKRESEQEDEDLKLLKHADEIKVSKAGNYRIDWDWIKWYDSYKDISFFMESLDKLEEMDIPYAFVRIGEDSDDTEQKYHYPDDGEMPDEIQSLEIVRDINDDEWGSYELYKPEDEPDDTTHISNIMFDLFEEYEEHDEIKDALRSLVSEGEVSDEEYTYALLNWDELVKVWEKARI